MKKIVLFLLAAAMLAPCVACSKGNEEKAKDNMEKHTISTTAMNSGDAVSATLWYPTDSGIEMAEGADESMVFFTDEADDYELICTLMADDTFSDIRDYASIYETMELGGRESYLYDEEYMLLLYVYLGSAGDEDAYLECNLYGLSDETPDLRAIMESDEVQAIFESIEY